jgi:hypothetical protein
MAKQKLTPEQRAALRTELKAQLAAGMERSEILKSLSEKYGITPEALRWYLNAESPNASTGKAKKAKAAKKVKAAKAKNRKPRAAKKAPKRARAKKAHPRKAPPNGRALHLPKVLGELTEKALKGLLAAKRLVPSLEVSRRREYELKTQIRSLSGELRAERTKARRIQRRIKKLARV